MKICSAPHPPLWGITHVLLRPPIVKCQMLVRRSGCVWLAGSRGTKNEMFLLACHRVRLNCYSNMLLLVAAVRRRCLSLPRRIGASNVLYYDGDASVRMNVVAMAGWISFFACCACGLSSLFYTQNIRKPSHRIHHRCVHIE